MGKGTTMNKKIIYITIIIILLLILVPTIYKVVKNHEKALYEVTNKKVIETAITCKNKGFCNKDKITLKELYELEMLSEVNDPVTKQIYNDKSYVIKDGDDYKFVVID